MFGWGLLALFRGAERYVFVEPMFNPILVTHPTAEYYFWLTHKDLTALYGPQMTYLDFRRAIDEKIEVHRVPMESFEEDISVDVFLSNSTLEHVQDLDEMIARFARCASPRAHFLHVVDFGNHQEKLRPFHGMYSMEPGTYHEKHGNEINLLRYPDMLRAFARQGMPADFVPYYHMDTFSEPIHPWWKDRYSQEELLLKVGLFINQRP